jgi:hypothetical protein
VSSISTDLPNGPGCSQCRLLRQPADSLTSNEASSCIDACVVSDRLEGTQFLITERTTPQDICESTKHFSFALQVAGSTAEMIGISAGNRFHRRHFVYSLNTEAKCARK